MGEGAVGLFAILVILVRNLFSHKDRKGDKGDSPSLIYSSDIIFASRAMMIHNPQTGLP
jgi:hypothetical protein